MFDIPTGDGDPAVRIHPTAMVADGAELGKGVVIGPYVQIGPQVKLHDWVEVQSHAIIEHDVTVGERTVIYPFATIGAAPQDLKYAGEATSVVIGKRNSLRQYVNVSRGTAGGGGVTRIGDDNILMIHVHIGHDSRMGDHCVFANGVSLAGHVEVQSHAIIGGHCAIHQFCRVGVYCITAGGAMVTQDLPPYCMGHGNRAAVNGLNVVGLKRAGFDKEALNAIKTMYKKVFKEGLTLEDALAAIEAEIPDSEYRRTFVDFIRASERGLCR